MNILFAASDKPRELQLAEAFAAGARLHGDYTIICHNGSVPDLNGFDAVAMVGVKSRKLFEKAKAAKAVPLMFDKGYIRSRRPGARTWEYWRISPAAHHPTNTSLMVRPMPTDRLDALELEAEPWHRRGDKIVIAGSSAKYHEFHGLADPTTYAIQLVDQIRQHSDLPIFYRPKPSWGDAVPIRGTTYSPASEAFRALMLDAWCMVTHGSNASFEAALWGIPSIVLGDGIGAPISGRTIADVRAPLRVKPGQRQQWLANLAYHQWTEVEMEAGQMWNHARGWVDDFKAV